MSGSLSAEQVSSQCRIDGARSFVTGCSVCLSASSVDAKDCNGECDVGVEWFDGFEEGGDVRRVV
jgi:hypothetical protein